MQTALSIGRLGSRVSPMNLSKSTLTRPHFFFLCTTMCTLWCHILQITNTREKQTNNRILVVMYQLHYVRGFDIYELKAVHTNLDLSAHNDDAMDIHTSGIPTAHTQMAKIEYQCRKTLVVEHVFRRSAIRYHWFPIR